MSNVINPWRAGVAPRRLHRQGLGLSLAAVLCLGVMGCGGGDGPSGPGSVDPGNSPRTDVPSELVGTWFSGSVSPTSFYNPHNGSWGSPGYGNGMFFTFTADGGYEKGVQFSSSLYGCGTLTLVYVRGTVTIDEARSAIELHPTYGKFLEQRTCPNLTSDERSLDLGPEHYPIFYGFGADENGHHKLWLRGVEDANWAPFTPKDW